MRVCHRISVSPVSVRVLSANMLLFETLYLPLNCRNKEENKNKKEKRQPRDYFTALLAQ